ncbi:MAG: aminoacyl-tRNA deacylase [Myxococcales bacterium]|nr:aminoacyl-tRNA deacylase [Myxococcales bacterium]
MSEVPVTTGVRFLRSHKVPFIPHLYEWEEHGGTKHSAQSLSVDEHQVIKTLVFENDQKKPLLVLMHGDREVSTKNLARFLGCKAVQPCTPQNVTRYTGYQVGGCSPFGTKQTLPVYVESTIWTLPRIFINGGKRGFLVELAPDVLRILSPEEISVAI